MSQTDAFIAKLEDLEDGNRAYLRQLTGQALDHTVLGFDLFTGLWWPLRKKSPRAPERRSAWLVAKLFGAFPVPHMRDGPASLPILLGRLEPKPSEDKAQVRFRQRFDALLLSPIARLEPHLGWALSVVRKAHDRGEVKGLDWVRLLDDLWKWDRGEGIQEAWADEFLTRQPRKG